jgi:hypothetical protein
MTRDRFRSALAALPVLLLALLPWPAADDDGKSLADTVKGTEKVSGLLTSATGCPAALRSTTRLEAETEVPAG